MARKLRHATVTSVQTFLRCAILSLAIPCFSQDKPAPATNRIEGQIFIARKDRETVKLSAVTVQIVPAHSVAHTLETCANFIKAETLRSEIAIQANQLETEFNDRLRALGAALPRMKPASAELARKTMASLRSCIESNRPFTGTITPPNRMTVLRAAHWPAVRTVQSDPDGNFSAVITNGQWTVIASASRAVFKEHEEEYFWIVPVIPGERTLLSNLNLFRE